MVFSVGFLNPVVLHIKTGILLAKFLNCKNSKFNPEVWECYLPCDGFSPVSFPTNDLSITTRSTSPVCKLTTKVIIHPLLKKI